MATKPTVPDLKELFKQAAEIAKQVPESMQEAAFNRAVDLLTHGISSAQPTQTGATKTTFSKAKRTSTASDSAPETSPLATLLASINSTQHPGVNSAAKVLDRALMLLQIARNDHDVDGLTPSEIAKILTEKFRVRTTAAATSMALGNATNLVNRTQEGQAYRYQIMSPGEDYLAHLGEPSSEKPTKPKRRRTPSATKNTPAKKAKPEKSSKAKGAKKAPSSSGGKIGPKAAVQALIDSGYFKQARTGPEVQDYLSKKRGQALGTAQLRLAMLRLVRDGKLDRDQNDSGHYEYTVP